MSTKARSRSKPHDLDQDAGRALWLSEMFLGDEDVKPCYSVKLVMEICKALKAKTCTSVIQFLYGTADEAPAPALDAIRRGFVSYDSRKGGKT